MNSSEKPPASHEREHDKEAQLKALREEWKLKTPGRVTFLERVINASKEEWPLLITEAASMAHYHYLTLDEFNAISEIIADGITLEGIAEKNRMMAASCPRQFEEKKFDFDKKRFDPLRRFLNEIGINEKEIEKINFEYRVFVGKVMPKNPGEPVTALVSSCTNYHDFLRERSEIPQEERDGLDATAWGDNADSKVFFMANKGFWDRFNNGGDLSQHRDKFYKLLYGAIKGECLPDEYSQWAQERQKNIDAEKSSAIADDDNRPKEKKVPVEATHEELERLRTAGRLAAARQAYADAYETYLLLHPDQKKESNAIISIGGKGGGIVYDEDLAKARADYDAALKASAESTREATRETLKESEPSLSEEELKSKVNAEVFKRCVIEEEERINRLHPHINGMPNHEKERPQEEGMVKKLWKSYARLPRWKKTLGSIVVGASIGAASGAAAGTLLVYAVRRVLTSTLVAPMAAGLSGAVTNAGIELVDRIKGREDTKEYRVNNLLRLEQEKASDISEKLDDMSREYREILQHEADREKSKAIVKAIVTIVFGAAMGAGTAAISHELLGHVADVGGSTNAIQDHADKAHTGAASSRATHHSAPLRPSRHSAPHPTEAPTQNAQGTFKFPTRPATEPLPQGSQNPQDLSEKFRPFEKEFPSDQHVSAPMNPEHSLAPVSPPAPEVRPAIPAIPGSDIKPEIHAEAPVVSAEQHVVTLDKNINSVWKATAHELKGNAKFENLTAPQQTWVISNLTNRAVEHHDAVGFQDADAIKAGTSLHLGSVMEPKEIDHLIERANHLSHDQLENIKKNNIAIAEWLKEHPGRSLDDHQVEQILKPQDNIIPPSEHIKPSDPLVEAMEHRDAVAQLGRTGEAVPLDKDGVRINPENLKIHDAPLQPYVVPPVVLHHENLIEQPTIEPPVGTIRNLIGYWDGSHVEQATRIAHDLENMGRFSTGERISILDALAHKMGVGREAWADVTIDNPTEVAGRAKDFLVSYPEARRFGFDSYEKYMGLRDMTVKRVTDQIPMNGHWADLLRHSTFHKGGHFKIIGRDGQWHSVPMTREQVQLGLALEQVADKSKHAGKTVSEMLADHQDLLNGRLAAVKREVSIALSREARHWKGE